MDEIELYSQTVEQAVLGAMLLDSKIAEQVVVKLSEGDFYGNFNRNIFAAIQMLILQKQPTDIVHVADYMEKHFGKRKDGYVCLSDLSDNVVSTVQTDSHVQTIKQYSMRRALLKEADKIKAIAYDVDKPIQEVYCDALSAIESTKPTNDNAKKKDVKSILIDTYFKVSERYDGKNLGVKTGIADFDRITGGLFGGELTVLAARPAVGKSALAMQMAIGCARNGKRVAFFSREMSEEQYGVRLFSYGSGVSTIKMRTGKVNDADFTAFNKVIQELGGLPIWIDTEARTPLQMRNECLNIGDIGVIMVDYLQIVHPNGKYQNRDQEIASMMLTYKDMTKELGAPVVLLSQLNREKSEEPKLTMLRESGSIEQSADNVIFLHEPTEWRDKNDQQTMIEYNEKGWRLVKTIIAKQKQGPIGYFNMAYKPEEMTFYSLMKE